MEQDGFSFEGKIYQLKIHLIDVSPMIWRRLLVRDDTSIAQLHGIIQLVMGWENQHLHCFRIYGKDYGISYSGGMGFGDDPRKVYLKDFQFKVGSKFFYDYDFHVDWKHQIRIEKILAVDAKKYYPTCIGGKNACPPENTLGIEHFSDIRDLFRFPLHDLLKIIRFQDNLGYAWRPDNFKRGTINALLRKVDYDYIGQNDPYFPDRTSPYFEDKYWHKKDDFQALKKMYHILKHNGVEVKDESDDFLFGEPTGWKVFHRMLEELSKPDEHFTSSAQATSTDETPQNS